MTGKIYFCRPMKTEPKLCAGVKPVLMAAPEDETQGFTRVYGHEVAGKTDRALPVSESDGSHHGPASDGPHLANSLKSLARMVARMTGLRLHVEWHGASGGGTAGGTPDWCPRARRQGVDSPGICATCHLRHWNQAVAAEGIGRRFRGQCGVQNYCVSLRAQSLGRLTLILQAMVVSSVFAGRRKRPARRGGWGREQRAGKVAAEAFNDAVALVRLMVGHWQAISGAGLAGREWEAAALEWGKIRSQPERPDGPQTPALPGRLDSPAHAVHAGKIVAAMRDFVGQNYHRPFGLNEVAAALKMNAAYLSALFSHHTGQKFRQFLEAVRLAKARELLGDPRIRIGEVAGATGYASPDAFRHAFKAREGLSPEAWRERR
jgi:AraC-like DNA-binding protein